MRGLGDRVDAAPLRLLCVVVALSVAARTLHLWPFMGFLETSAVLFPYEGLEWLPRPPGGPTPWLLGSLVGALGVVVAPRFQRPMASLSLACFAFLFFQDQAFYGHMSYLLIWLMALVCVAPSGLHTTSRVRRWMIWAPRGLLAIMYFAAGAAKLYPEWMDGAVIEMFAHKADMPPELLVMTTQPWVLRTLAVAGTIFDLAIGPALLWRPTRKLGLIAMALFHMGNMLLVGILILPIIVLSITAAAFLDPRQARALLRWDREPLVDQPVEAPARLKVALAGILVLHIWLPLRPYIYEGNSRWTHQAQHFAWWMRSTTTTTSATFFVEAPGLARQKIDPLDYIDMQQASMAHQPRLLLHFAREVARDFARRGYPGGRVFADVRVSVNGRPESWLVPPELDLAHLPAQTSWREVTLAEGERLVPLSP